MARELGTTVSVVRVPRLFLHFFDIHFIAEREPLDPLALIEMRRATRMAVAISDYVFVPASSFYESERCRRIIPEMQRLFEFGLIVLSGSAPSLSLFIEEHRDDSLYRPGSVQHTAYATAQTSEAPPYQQRRRSATADIVQSWAAGVQSDLLSELFWQQHVDPRIEQRLVSVPDELGELAFTPEHVFSVLDVAAHKTLLRNRLSSFINAAYFGSFTKDVSAGIVNDLYHLQAPFLVPSYSPGISYRRMMRFLHRHGKLRELDECDALLLMEIADDSVWQEGIRQAIVPALFNIPRTLDEATITGDSPVASPVRLPRVDQANNPIIIKNFIVIMGDQYTIGQAGAVGPGAHAQDLAFSQQSLELAGADTLQRLAGELSRLRAVLSVSSGHAEHRMVAAEVTFAERAARDGDGKAVLKHLALAGKMALDTATAIGTEVAAAAIKASMILP